MDKEPKKIADGSKKVMFKFADGFKEIQVGQQALIFHHKTESIVKIKKIGRTLITLDTPREMQFYIETGFYKSDYSNGVYLYSSEEAYRDQCQRRETIGFIYSNVSYTSSALVHLNNDELAEIKEILQRGIDRRTVGVAK